ncbi:UNVERIFIED_CONTAM: hypothetical protein FKN15_064608 [Acipenser sinensis]
MEEIPVKVAVRLRPLLPKEILHNQQVCVRVVPYTQQVIMGKDRAFTFDFVFGQKSLQNELYVTCIKPLVLSLIEGYNVTVFFYGQTGSGKTYTIGGGHVVSSSDEEKGIIPRAIQEIFHSISENHNRDFTVKVSYIEVYKEELRDLLELETSFKDMHIREDEKGNTVIVGARESLVETADEVISLLESGNAARHTGTTQMNKHSSRSHTIFTITLISSKFHFFDLAGSERAAKTGNTGERFKESIQINSGLLALGNVISALGDPKRKSLHVPYRDTKITRILKDSLGGNTKTVMITCISPSSLNFDESLNSLKYANRAKNIKNKPIVNYNPNWYRMDEMELEIRALREALQNQRASQMTCASRVSQDLPGGHDKTRNCAMEGQLAQLQVECYQYRACTENAILLELKGMASLPKIHKHKLQEWLDTAEELQRENPSTLEADSGVGSAGEETHHITILQLKRELKKCQENEEHLAALEDEKSKRRIQNEKMVEQQLIIDQLREGLLNIKQSKSCVCVNGAGDAAASVTSSKRPYSVPLGNKHQPDSSQNTPRPDTRKVHTSPPVYSLDRVMAAFRTQSQMLIAQIEEQDEVLCHEISDSSEEEEKDDEKKKEGKLSFRRSMNRTWTRRQTPLVTEPNLHDLFINHKKNNVGNENDPDYYYYFLPIWNGQLFLGSAHRYHPCSDLGGRRRTHAVLRSVCHQPTAFFSHCGLTMQPPKSYSIGHAALGQLTGKPAGAWPGYRGDELEAALAEEASLRQSQTLNLHNLKDAELRLTQAKQKTKELAINIKMKEELIKELVKTENRKWLDDEVEKVLQQRRTLAKLEDELKKREEIIAKKEALSQGMSQLEIKKLRSSQALSKDILTLSTCLSAVDKELSDKNNQFQGSSAENKKRISKEVEVLQQERNQLLKRRDCLDDTLRNGRVLTAEEEHILFQLEERIEALDAAIDFKNDTIDSQQHCARDSTEMLTSSEAGIMVKLSTLSFSEIKALLFRYFNKVVCLRESERKLQLQCEEMGIQMKEEERIIHELESALERLTLEMDRHLTLQQKEHEQKMQLILQGFKEQGSDGLAENINIYEAKVRQLEKDLFFYKKTSRELKKKLKEIVADSLNQQSASTKEQGSDGLAENINIYEAKVRQLEKDLFFYKKTSRELKKKLKEIVADSLNQQSASTKGNGDDQEKIVSISEEDKWATKFESNKANANSQKDSASFPTSARAQNSRIWDEIAEIAQTPTSASRRHLASYKEQSAVDEAPYLITALSSVPQSGDSAAQLPGVTPVRVSRRELRQISASELSNRRSSLGASVTSIQEDSIEIS